MIRPALVALAFAALGVAPLAGCGGDDEAPVLRVDLIDDALDAATAELGDDVGFFEVNATPELVNLFVQVDGADGGSAVAAYVYEAEGGLADPSEPTAADGPTFRADQVADLEPDVLDQVLDELPSSTPRLFAVLGARGGDATTTGPVEQVEYRVVLESSQGGSLSVVVQPDGSIVGVDAE